MRAFLVRFSDNRFFDNDDDDEDDDDDDQDNDDNDDDDGGGSTKELDRQIHAAFLFFPMTFI